MSSETLRIDVVHRQEPDNEEERFFSNYQWALNPYLRLSELVERLQVELDNHGGWRAGWQIEESRINLYIMACAINCTLDDYLLRRPWYIKPLGRRFPQLRGMIPNAERLLNFFPAWIGSLKLRGLRKWKKKWDSQTEAVCRLLVESRDLRPEESVSLRQALVNLRGMNLPEVAWNARMKINEGFRCQDLNYRDVFTLGDRYLENHLDRKRRTVIVGSRTAGSYLCPLLKVHFENRGVHDISWIAIRPKFGLHEYERDWLKKELSHDTDVVLIDDFSNTGNTFRLLEENVKAFGVPPGKIVVLAPIHPHKPVGELRADSRVKVIMLNHDDLYLRSAMEPDKVESMLREHYLQRGVQSISIRDNNETNKINQELWGHYSDSYQVRFKRVYDISVLHEDGTSETKRIVGKAVGLGWLGYHAYLVSVAMREFVPRLVALRSGILFMEWVRGAQLTRHELSERDIERMSTYLATRAEKLSLKEDPKSEVPYLSWGWLEILALLRQAYGTLFGYGKNRILLSRLKKALHPMPTLVDGRMRLDEWLRTDSGILKIDFEHHNFGPPELDVVDPAYDIAISSFEFPLDEQEEEKMVRDYSVKSGDRATISERVFLYKLLFGAAESERMMHMIMDGRGKEYQDTFHLRYLRGWNFRVYTMNRFAAGLLHHKFDRIPSHGTPLLFLDLDGVFDAEYLGFPHPTINGLKAIELLSSNGYSIIPNTGRSLEHVKNYCKNYGFVAGIGEYGSVIFDNVQNLEIPLVDDAAWGELATCREVLARTKGVFVDPNYQHAVRAFRYTDRGTAGLTIEEAESVLNKGGFKELTTIIRGADTYFVGRRNNKGSAVESYKDYIGYGSGITVAVGDSDEDIPMFDRVGLAFTPHNCSDRIKNLAKQRNWKVVSMNRQSGLLQIAETLAGGKQNVRSHQYLKQYMPGTFESMMIGLLTIADYPLYKRALSLLYKNRLGPGVN